MKLFKFIPFYDKVILMMFLISVSGNDSPIGIRNLNNGENQADNYIIIQFYKDVNLNFNTFNNLKNINYIKFGDTNYSSNIEISVTKYNEVEIHFNEVSTNLYYFFKDSKNNCRKIV